MVWIVDRFSDDSLQIYAFYLYQQRLIMNNVIFVNVNLVNDVLIIYAYIYNIYVFHTFHILLIYSWSGQKIGQNEIQMRCYYCDNTGSIMTNKTPCHIIINYN